MRHADLPQLIAEMNAIIDAAATQPEHWQEVAETLRRRLGNIKVVLQAWDRGKARPFLLVSAGWSPAALRNYADHYAQLNPWTAMWSSMPHLAPVWTDSVLPNAQLRKTEFYQDFLRLEGEGDSGTTTKLIDDAGRLATFGINYASAEAEDMHALLDPAMKSLAANMRRAIDMNRTLYRSTDFAAAASGGEWLSSLLDPVLVVDQSLRLLDANEPARKLIDAAELFRIGARNHLQFRDTATHTALSERIRLACEHGDMPASLASLTLDHATGRYLVTIVVVRQNHQAMTLKGIRPLFLPAAMVLLILRQEPLTRSGEAARGGLV